MYSDRVEAETVSKNTVKNRLNGGSGDLSSRGRQVTRKRGRQEDDKWEHDLFDDDTNPRLSSFEMYSDRVEAETVSKNTVKNRLNGGSGDLSSRGRQVTRKRFFSLSQLFAAFILRLFVSLYRNVDLLLPKEGSFE
ncbi:hypothetical protein F2Q70_00032113 [Brassica cretica]|uniref:Uncharacterized protein n=1 Tax=Brassica cretica TaxID=69181 RepID=A0A8S9FHV3_BRACR|nr:hypothetical protein F2Q70_00032113 [Brassica cretica]